MGSKVNLVDVTNPAVECGEHDCLSIRGKVRGLGLINHVEVDQLLNFLCNDILNDKGFVLAFSNHVSQMVAVR